MEISRSGKFGISRLNLPCWAVVAKHAYVPFLYAIWDQQPLTLKGPPLLRPREISDHYEIDDTPEFRQFDYVWVFNPAGRDFRLPASCKFICSKGFVSLWKND